VTASCAADETQTRRPVASGKDFRAAPGVENQTGGVAGTRTAAPGQKPGVTVARTQTAASETETRCAGVPPVNCNPPGWKSLAAESRTRTAVPGTEPQVAESHARAHELGAAGGFRSTKGRDVPRPGGRTGSAAEGRTTQDAAVYSSTDRNGDGVAWRAH